MKLVISQNTVQSVQHDFTLILQLSGQHFIAISSPVTITQNDKRITLSPEDDPDEHFEPIRNLVGRTVVTGEVDDRGGLHITFDGGTALEVQADPEYEAWNVAGPRGSLVVSMPGGQLGIWSAEPAEEGQ